MLSDIYSIIGLCMFIYYCLMYACLLYYRHIYAVIWHFVGLSVLIFRSYFHLMSKHQFIG